MRWPYACYSFSDVENLGFHHYIQYMMTDTKWLIKVQYPQYKRPRWTLVLPHVVAIQKSRKSATRFQTIEEAMEIAAYIGCSVRNVEIVEAF